MLKILPRPNGVWYIGFHHDGLIKLLPRRKRLFRNWYEENCPVFNSTPLQMNSHLHFLNRAGGGLLTIENLHEIFYARYTSVAGYLQQVNNRAAIHPIIHADALWELRNLHDRCGKCGIRFSELNRDNGGGMCTSCWSQSH
jgi:hypothetical protein